MLPRLVVAPALAMRRADPEPLEKATAPDDERGHLDLLAGPAASEVERAAQRAARLVTTCR